MSSGILLKMIRAYWTKCHVNQRFFSEPPLLTRVLFQYKVSPQISLHRYLSFNKTIQTYTLYHLSCEMTLPLPLYTVFLEQLCKLVVKFATFGSTQYQLYFNSPFLTNVILHTIPPLPIFILFVFIFFLIKQEPNYNVFNKIVFVHWSRENLRIIRYFGI